MVVRLSGVPVDQELAFTDRLIGSNFSNYSSWHYRSTLLPLLHPQPEAEPPRASSPPPPSPQSRSHRVCEEQLLKEYELVQNAFFTDPNDQSAWFYYRWLLGRAEHEEMISCMLVSREDERVSVAFSRTANSAGLLLVLDGQPQKVEWRSVHPQLKHSPICDLAPGSISDVSNEHNLTVHWMEKHTHRDCALYSGCLLTIILLMRALDPLGYEKETLAHFQTLQEVDSMRSAYYGDLCSKFMIENTVLKMEYAEVRVFSISDKGLTTLCHLDQLLLVTHINLSSNQLRRLPPQFSMLQCLEVLKAEDNSLEDLEGVRQLLRLEEVLLKNNSILTL
ncbi:Geranylgeranyl transferase type-2 subunit alpha [Liparis tanakae]|uniref:Geranylgeranyl transferase type-2 subunit alpha n=1 Tax=Liparis tanakae TaxID=230148 RepID=A0A4Z2EM58_9TELE|nr:Geranylgeranyl transferase type-2 subunit alpha [Liparis tanakae]